MHRTRKTSARTRMLRMELRWVGRLQQGTRRFKTWSPRKAWILRIAIGVCILSKSKSQAELSGPIENQRVHQWTEPTPEICRQLTPKFWPQRNSKKRRKRKQKKHVKTRARSQCQRAVHSPAAPGLYSKIADLTKIFSTKHNKPWPTAMSRKFPIG
jgi:hypothetical protein